LLQLAGYGVELVTQWSQVRFPATAANTVVTVFGRANFSISRSHPDHVLLLHRVASDHEHSAVSQQASSLVAGYVTCPDMTGLWKHQPRWHIWSTSWSSTVSTQRSCTTGLWWSKLRPHLAFAPRPTLASRSTAYQVSSSRSRLPLSKQHSTRVLVKRLAVGSRQWLPETTTGHHQRASWWFREPDWRRSVIALLVPQQQLGSGGEVSRV